MVGLFRKGRKPSASGAVQVETPAGPPVCDVPGGGGPASVEAELPSDLPQPASSREASSPASVVSERDVVSSVDAFRRRG